MHRRPNAQQVISLLQSSRLANYGYSVLDVFWPLLKSKVKAITSAKKIAPIAIVHMSARVVARLMSAVKKKTTMSAIAKTAAINNQMSFGVLGVLSCPIFFRRIKV